MRKGAEREERRERDKSELRQQFEEEEEACLCLLFNFLKALRFSYSSVHNLHSSEDTSSRLDSAVTRCSSEVLVSSRVAW